jgi:hypothetical protein
MKTYIIKDTDLMINGSLVPEGTKIELNDEDAKLLSPYLTLQGESVIEHGESDNQPETKKKTNVKGNKNVN